MRPKKVRQSKHKDTVFCAVRTETEEYSTAKTYQQHILDCKSRRQCYLGYYETVIMIDSKPIGKISSNLI